MLALIHHGAVSGVAGSCHELTLHGPGGVAGGILVDCGIFQGDEAAGRSGADAGALESPAPERAARAVSDRMTTRGNLMPQYQAVSRTVHGARRWRRYDSYRFAAADTIATLVARELPRAMMHLPIAFVARGERYSPAAVQGLQAGKNLFVAPDGRWIGGYTPAAYRGYPFALAETPDGKRVLAFDADSGLLSESDGETFFDEEGNPSSVLRNILDFLNEVQANREVTERICAALQQHGLIQPWPVTVAGEDGKRSLDGLYRIDEAALNALPAADFESLRQAGALPVAYCQLLSMQHFPMLGRLAHAQQQAERPLPQTPSGDLDLEFLNAGDTISFGGL